MYRHRPYCKPLRHLLTEPRDDSGDPRGPVEIARSLERKARSSRYQILSTATLSVVVDAQGNPRIMGDTSLDPELVHLLASGLRKAADDMEAKVSATQAWLDEQLRQADAEE